MIEGYPHSAYMYVSLLWEFFCVSERNRTLEGFPAVFVINGGLGFLFACFIFVFSFMKFLCHVHSCMFLIENWITEISPTYMLTWRFHSSVSTFMELKSTWVAKVFPIWLIFIRILPSMGPCMTSKRIEKTEDFITWLTFTQYLQCVLFLCFWKHWK